MNRSRFGRVYRRLAYLVFSRPMLWLRVYWSSFTFSVFHMLHIRYSRRLSYPDNLCCLIINDILPFFKVRWSLLFRATFSCPAESLPSYGSITSRSHSSSGVNSLKNCHRSPECSPLSFSMGLICISRDSTSIYFPLLVYMSPPVYTD